MKKYRQSKLEHTGFTLPELLVAIVILSLIVVVVGQMLSSAQLTISLSRKLLDCDDQARLAFERMQNDFSKIVKRTDVDFIFSKQAGNDKIFFYSQSIGDTSNTTSFPNGVENPVSLVGYVVAADPNIKTNTPNDLQRLGRGLNWLPSSAISAKDNMVFLTAAPTTTSYFDPASTLDGHWSITYGAAYNSIGTPPSYTPTTRLDPDYHVLGQQIFRFEYCFLLKDGTYSDYPVEANSANVPANFAPLLVYTRTPTSSDDNTLSVATGTRWFDTNAGRAYVCTSAATKAATWQGLGVQDVAAIIVTIAVIDPNSENLITNAGGKSAGLASLLPDSGLIPTGSGVNIANIPANSGNQSVQLPLQLWKAQTNSTTFASSLATATGIPAAVASQVASHISTYQRYFYLSSATSL